MARVISFLVLVGFILVFAALFYQVIAPFLLPLFLAGVLALLFRPWFHWFRERLNGRQRLAAGATTVVVVLVVLIPVAGTLTMATVQLVRLVPQTLRRTSALYSSQPESPLVTSLPENREAIASAGEPNDSARLGRNHEDRPDRKKLPDGPTVEGPGSETPPPTAENPDTSARTSSPDETSDAEAETGLHQWRAELIQRVQSVLPVQAEQVNQAIDSAIAALAERTVRLLVDLVGFIVGMLITVVALYFFFVDGPRMLETLQRLTPMEDRHERELMKQFDTVCRAVVFATLASAVVQGLLAGIGFLIVGLHRQVFVLSILTTLFAMIPFLGTAVVWLPTAAILWWADQRWEAIFLVIYGAGCVATVDNLIKPYILHGRAKLHPLLALLSVLGGVQALGLWGIFIGPMVAAFLYALLNILHQELKAFAEADRRRKNADAPETASAKEAPKRPAKAKKADKPPRGVAK